MRLSDLFGSAARALGASPLRSALTALGVVIGVGSVVAMVSLGQGAQKAVQASLASLGSNLLVVVPGAQRQAGVFTGPGGGSNTLILEDAEAIQRDVQDIAATAPVQRAGGQMVYGGLNWQASLQGTTPAFQVIREWDMASGRFLDQRDVDQARKVAVIGQTVVDNLFPNVDPVGQRVRISGTPFEVIGVLAKKGQSGFGQDQDDTVIAPFTTVKRRFSGRQGRANTVSQILVKVATEESLEPAQESINLLLRERHKIAPGERDDFTVQNLASIVESSQQALGVFTALLASIAAVSLFVGGVGIMSIMLVSVTERTREIGLRKALGATNGDVLSQFTLEAVALSIAGGLVGLGLGIGAGQIMSALAKVPFAVDPTVAAMAVGVSALVGIVFGIWPAWRASRLDPIVALRRD